MLASIVMLIFLLFSDQISGGSKVSEGGGKLPEGGGKLPKGTPPSLGRKPAW